VIFPVYGSGSFRAAETVAFSSFPKREAIMAVYTHPRCKSLKVAYTWLGSRIPTPAWFDDNEMVRGTDWVFAVWARFRSWGVVRLRYWGRS
jgi:hypothetical protein